MNSQLFRLACWGLAFSVILGAFGGHSLKPILSAYEFSLHETALEYLRLACFGLLAFSLAFPGPEKTLGASGKRKYVPLLFSLGALLFSGSLYLIIFSGQKVWGMITPLGGLCLIAAFAWMGFTSSRNLP